MTANRHMLFLDSSHHSYSTCLPDITFNQKLTYEHKLKQLHIFLLYGSFI